MNKNELIKKMSERNGILKEVNTSVLETFIDLVKDLDGEEYVKIKDFGTFKVKIRKERNGFDPHLKERVVFPQSKYIGFEPGKSLKGK